MFQIFYFFTGQSTVAEIYKDGKPHAVVEDRDPAQVRTRVQQIVNG